MTTWRLMLDLVGAYLFGGCLYFGYWIVIRRRFVEVIPGWCYQSAEMSPAVLERFVREYNIDSVFDFRGATDRGVQAESVRLAQLNRRHVNIPCGRAPTAEALQTFLREADAERAAGHRILLHCKDGQGRAIYFAAVALMEYTGLNAAAAYLAVRRIPPSLRWIRFFVPRAGLLGRNNPKYRMILDYQARRAS